MSILAAIGIGVSLLGGLASSSAAKKAANYQARVARQNERLAKRKSADAILRGEFDVTRQRAKTQQLIGAQRSGAAARGVVVDEGSALEGIVDTAGIGELDALLIRSNAERESQGLIAQAQGFKQEAGFASATASGIARAAPIAALGTLATGLGSVSAKWWLGGGLVIPQSIAHPGR